ncbi:MAG: hypothetical protein LBV47_01170 [Bacteroidales bacterium]|jgi:hypothetical protein|nr:hypothetical protein [Bacteroidales bacterium]
MGKSFKGGLDAMIQNTSVQIDSDSNEKELEAAQTFMIPVTLKKEMKIYCAQRNIKIKDLILRGIRREMKVDDGN